MSNWKTRDAQRAEWEAEQERKHQAQREEACRKAGLTMWMRIHESGASDDVKEILHMMAEKLGME